MESGTIKGNPWVDVAIKFSAQMGVLSTELGINVNSTLAARNKLPKAAEPKNKRDRLLFGGKG